MSRETRDQIANLSMLGKFRGRVIDNVDGSMEGMLALFIPSLHIHIPSDNQDKVPMIQILTGGMLENPEDVPFKPVVDHDCFIWVRPDAWFIEKGKGSELGTGGSYRVPRIGTWVSVYFENGDPNKPYWSPSTPTVGGDKLEGINVGKAKGTANAGANWNDAGKRVNMNVITEQADGTVIVIDDNGDSKSIALYNSNGHHISIYDNAESGITLQTLSGHDVTLDDINGKIIAKTSAGHVLDLDDKNGKILAKTVNGHTLDMDDNGGKITVTTSSGAATWKMEDGGGITIKGTKIDLNP